MNRLKWIVLNCLMRCMSLLPIKRKKIVFCSFQGKGYSCNPRYIFEKIYQLAPRLEFVWILEDTSYIPQNVRTISPKSKLRMMYELATARVWVDNCRKPIWTYKRKKQLYIQTWHGGIALKQIEKDAADSLPNEYVCSAIHDSKMVDLMLSNSRWLSNLYRNSFWYDGKILEKGLPREDVLFLKQNNICDRFNAFFGVDNEVKCILYAPTFRKDKDVNCYNIDYERVVRSVEHSLGGKWRLLIRLHPGVQGLQTEFLYNNVVLNASEYPDINDLILRSEFVITDYSSCMFDALLAKKKVVLYANDVEKYANDRGYYFSWNELPFNLTTNTEELIEGLISFDNVKYTEKAEEFLKRCDVFKCGKASLAVARYIIKYMKH